MVRFVYYNLNPKGVKEEDCVTRAITMATGLPYNEVAKKLYYSAKLLDCDKLNVCCYKHLLDDTFKFHRVKCAGLTVAEFAEIYPTGIYIIRMDGHLSVLIDQTIYDLWNCKDEILTDAWRVD